MAADSEDRIIGPEHRAGRGIIEAHGGSASSDEWDETARRINQKIQNNEQLTVEEQACVIETPKVRNAKKLCQQVGDQYTYQNNNAMVDYFDTDGYVTVQAVTGIKKPENKAFRCLVWVSGAGGGGAGRVVWGYGYHVVVHRRPATA